MSESLYLIEYTLLQIQESRAEAEREGDSEALKAFDAIEREYLTKEAAKVTSYVGLIHSNENTVAAAQGEIDRLMEIRDGAKRNIDRLKAHALAVMQQFGVKELKAAPGGGLRRHANGGVQALEINDRLIIPARLCRVRVDLPLPVFELLVRACVGVPQLDPYLDTCVKEPDSDAIREALKQRVLCPECNGDKVHEVADGAVEYACQRCNAEGTIPKTVPGARLLPRAEHVRVI